MRPIEAILVPAPWFSGRRAADRRRGTRHDAAHGQRRLHRDRRRRRVGRAAAQRIATRRCAGRIHGAAATTAAAWWWRTRFSWASGRSTLDAGRGPGSAGAREPGSCWRSRSNATRPSSSRSSSQPGRVRACPARAARRRPRSGSTARRVPRQPAASNGSVRAIASAASATAGEDVHAARIQHLALGGDLRLELLSASEPRPGAERAGAEQSPRSCIFKLPLQSGGASARDPPPDSVS